MKSGALLLLVVVASLGQALADTPPMPPTLETTCSSSGRLCAISDPATHTTRIVTGFGPPALWSIPGWHPFLLVSNDGESVVVVYDGADLVQVDVKLSEPVLSFWHHGKLIRKVTLGDLYQDESQLIRTVSHYAWWHDIKLNQANQVVIKLVTGKLVAYAAATGLREELKLHGT